MHRRLLVSFSTLVLLLLAGLAVAGGASAGGGCHVGTGRPSVAEASVVKIDGCTYLPSVTSVPVGTEVLFLNSGTSPHDVTGRMGEWGSRILEVGGSYSHRFAAAGVYPYSCSLHPGMAGVVVVGEPQVGLASTVQPTTTEPVPASGDGLAISVALAGGIGLLVGAIAAGLVLRRGDATE